METQLNLFAAVQVVRVAPKNIWAVENGPCHLWRWSERDNLYIAACNARVRSRKPYLTYDNQPAQCCARCRELAGKEGR